MSSHFQPISWATNPHLQTLLPRIFRRKPAIKPFWQRLTLPDNDFIDLAWSEDPDTARDKPRLVIFHGLEGSFRSPYAHGILAAAARQGWLGVVMHFRGCSGEPNRSKRIYHSGETEDARYLLNWLQDTYGKVPTGAVGYSLGGNMLACYLAEEGENAAVDAGIVVSAPLMLEPCSFKMEKGFSRFYQWYLLKGLKRNATRKLVRYPNSLPTNLLHIRAIKRIREFDDIITSRIHGFRDASDYYRRCSALPKLPAVRKPMLIIHAKDDPFMAQEVVPDLSQLPPCVEYQMTEHGGHVGFVSGSWRRPRLWLEERIPEWLAPHLAAKETP